jgi:hypothetical protein
MKEIPARPTHLDGAVYVGKLPEHVDTGYVRDTLRVFGDVSCCERLCTSSALVTFGTHEAALAASSADGTTLELGDSCFLCLAYNARPYDERGWVSSHGRPP